jgi:hypothetical protein
MPNRNVPLYIPAWYRKLQQDPAAYARYQQFLTDSETAPVAVPMLPLPAPPPGAIGVLLAVWSGAPVPAGMEDLWESTTVWLNAVSKVVAR